MTTRRMPDAVIIRSCFREIPVYKLDRNGSLSDPRGYALDGSMANVSGDKNTGHTAFQEIGVARECPARWTATVLIQVRAADNKTMFIALHDSRQPFSVGHRSDEDEQISRRDRLALIGFQMGYGDGLETGVSRGLHDVDIGFHHDIRNLLDLVDQIPGHTLNQ